MATKRTAGTDDTEDMLRAASMPPHEQVIGVLQFIRADLDSDPTNWSGFLKGLPRRPYTSESGRVRVHWMAGRAASPRPISRAVLEELQGYFRDNIRNLLGFGDIPGQRR